MKKVEILAPAGSYESLCGAVNGGCDAVYLGGSQFGARAFAENFDEETMLRAIDYVHMFDKKLYLTVNTLLHNEEIEEELFSYLEKYYMQGLDAVIVQDVGVLSFIHRNFPKLPIHASTQMTFTTEAGGEYLQNYGVTRFVTSRELGLQELQAIRQKTQLEVETFVHGALCYCYSGQCFLSSMIGGRSGNRGRCAQPCRMPYRVYDEDGGRRKSEPYVLSPKDMCTLDRIPDLVDAGIDSFKIEGRMKKPEYAAYTAYLYRKYTDLYLEYGENYPSYLEKHRAQLEQEYTCLMDLYNRGGFSTGYFYDRNGKKTMSMARPNHSGVLVGNVQHMKKNRASVSLVEDIYAQDVLEFRKKDGRVLYEYTVKESERAGNITETNTKPGSGITSGDQVYRTRRNELLNWIQEQILGKQRRIPVSFLLRAKVGESLTLTCSSGNTEVTQTGPIVESAKSQPMTREKIEKQLNKLTNTCFFMEKCEISLDGQVFIPVGQLNDLRRSALEKLAEAIVKKYRREVPVYQALPEDGLQSAKTEPGLVVMATTPEQANVAFEYSEVQQLYIDLAVWQEVTLLEFLQKCSKPVYLALPAILRRKDYDTFEEAFQNIYERHKVTTTLQQILAHERVAGFLLRNYEAVQLYERYVAQDQRRDARLDYNMYLFNRETKHFWKEHGILQGTAAIELNGAELRRNGCEEMDILVYGRPAVMTSAQCVCKNTGKCTGQTAYLVLQDRFEKEFVSVNRCSYCYNQLYEKVPISLHTYLTELEDMHPQHFRLDFMRESPEEVKKILDYYVCSMQKEEAECPIEAYTTGHFRKGVK